jgi:hypothetical protein
LIYALSYTFYRSPKYDYIIHGFMLLISMFDIDSALNRVGTLQLDEFSAVCDNFSEVYCVLLTLPSSRVILLKRISKRLITLLKTTCLCFVSWFKLYNLSLSVTASGLH